MFCKHCGAQLSDESLFCTKCGKNVADVQIAGLPSAPNSPYGLHRMPLCLLIFLSAITLGIYYPIWFMRQRDALNKLNSVEKLSYGVLVTCIVLQSISLLFSFMSGFAEGLVGVSSDESKILEGIGSIIGLISTIILIVQSFKIRRIFIDDFSNQFSGVATFFFGGLYLQYKINRF